MLISNHTTQRGQATIIEDIHHTFLSDFHGINGAVVSRVSRWPTIILSLPSWTIVTAPRCPRQHRCHERYLRNKTTTTTTLQYTQVFRSRSPVIMVHTWGRNRHLPSATRGRRIQNESHRLPPKLRVVVVSNLVVVLPNSDPFPDNHPQSIEIVVKRLAAAELSRK